MRWGAEGDAWLARQHKRIVDDQLREQALRQAPPEVTHRYVQGRGDVIQRRLR